MRSAACGDPAGADAISEEALPSATMAASLARWHRGRVAGVVEQRALPSRGAACVAPRQDVRQAMLQPGVVERLAGSMVGELDEGQHLGERDAHPLEIGAAQPAHATRLGAGGRPI